MPIVTIGISIFSGRNTYYSPGSTHPWKMEIRRVQMTGGSSYVLTLPKEWIHSLNIRKNDPLGVITQGNGDLLITGNITDTVVHRGKVFEVTGNEDPSFFFRSLVGAYIAGYNGFEIQSRQRLPPAIRKTIRDFSDQVIGLEPVEEEECRILLRDLFNPLEMPFDNSVKRMYVIARGMHTDAVVSLGQKDPDLARDVIVRDREVDRLYWLIARQASIILNHPRYGERMNTTGTRVSHYFQTARIIERIADHAVVIADSLIGTDPDEVNDEIVSAVKKASEEAMQAFDQSITTFFSGDMKKANRIIESVVHQTDTFHQINSGILHCPTRTALQVRKITDSIRRVEEYSSDIAELVINFEIMQGDDIAA